MADFQLTAFQENKILRVFTTFFDVNNDGVIEWEDFEIAIEKIRKLHDWTHGSDKHLKALDTLRLMWEGLKTYADQNQDDKITKEEWLKMWRECVKATDHHSDLPEWQQKYMDFMFDVNDTSGDRFIDRDEYTTVYTSYGLSKEDCEQAFDKFAVSGKVDREEFSRLWTEYFLATDADARGNFIFGLLDF